MKKVILMVLATLLVASAFACMSVTTASAVEPVTPFLLLEGEDLLPDRNRYPAGWVSQCSGELDADTGIVRLTALGRDPYYHLLKQNTRIAPVLAIKYRTDVVGVEGKIYSSVGPVKEGHSFTISYNYDGDWDLKVLPLDLWLPAVAYNPETHVLDHLRYDFIDGAREGEWIEVEYVAFFNTEEEAELYDDIRSGRVTVTPETTETETETVVETEAVTVIDTETETTTEVVADVVTEAATEATVETTEVAVETTATAPAVAGCKAVIASASILSVVAMAAGVAVCKKKE